MPEPQDVPYKYYKQSVNGKDYVEALASPNTPFGYSEIGADEFSNIAKNQYVDNSYGAGVNYYDYLSKNKPAAVPGSSGASDYVIDPTTGAYTKRTAYDAAQTMANDPNQVAVKAANGQTYYVPKGKEALVTNPSANNPAPLTATQTTGGSPATTQVASSSTQQPGVTPQGYKLKNAGIAQANPAVTANENYINALYQEGFGRNATKTELAKFAASTVKDAANTILGQSKSPFATPIATPTVNPPGSGVPGAEPGSSPITTQPTAPAANDTFYKTGNAEVDRLRQLVENTYKTKIDELQSKIDAQEKITTSAQASEKGIVDTNNAAIMEDYAAQKKIMLDAQQQQIGLTSQLQGLLQRGNDLIMQQKNATGLSIIKDPRVAQTVADVTAQAGIIQAVLAAQTTTISNAQGIVDFTVRTLNAATQDQINYYKDIITASTNKTTSLTTEQNKFVAAKIGQLENDLKVVQDNAEKIKDAMTNPTTAMAYGQAGVSLTDSPEVVAQKLATWGYSQEISKTSNDMAEKGYSALAPGQKAPANSETFTITDSKGVAHNFYKAKSTGSVTPIIQEYEYYKAQEIAAGRKPVSFDTYQTADANRKATKSTSITYNQSQEQEQKSDVTKLGTFLSGKIGADKYVSPEDYKDAKNSWVSDGYTAADFDKTFSNFVNPEIDYMYGASFK